MLVPVGKVGKDKQAMQKKSTLAANLCRLRQLSRLSQEAVAERIGVTRQAIAKWESGGSLR